MPNRDLSDLRKEYQQDFLEIENMLEDPIKQFAQWFEQAEQNKGILEATAMTLATADQQGRPSARIVLLKELTPEGFMFYTNYNSEKGRHLASNPYASLSFFWPAMERQVRIEGQVSKLDADKSDKYFASRPRGSRLGAMASAQSQKVSSRSAIEAKLAELESQYPEGSSIPRPAHWGGYILAPERIEFWQGRPNRLHDRLSYQKEGSSWVLDRLCP